MASDQSFLIWEDEEPGSEQWWLARAHESDNASRDFFIAEDDLTGYLVGIVRRDNSSSYKVISATPISSGQDTLSFVSSAKAAVTLWVSTGEREHVWRWRLARWLKLTWLQTPIAFAGFVVGGLLGLIFGFFAVSSGIVGWPMLAAGLAIGAGAGPALKFLVDRRPKQPVVGPWVRFVVVTLSASAGAAVSAGGVFALFWGA